MPPSEKGLPWDDQTEVFLPQSDTWVPEKNVYFRIK